MYYREAQEFLLEVGRKFKNLTHVTLSKSIRISALLISTHLILLLRPQSDVLLETKGPCYPGLRKGGQNPELTVSLLSGNAAHSYF